MNFKAALIEIRPSKMLLGEIGVFAVRDLSIGTIVGFANLIDEEQFILWSEYERLDIETKRIIDKYCIGTNDGFYAPYDINHIAIPWHYNHSCNPNIGFDINGNFVIIKNVKKNEELTYDYAFGESNKNFIMHCKCNSENCRKIITGNDWKDPIFYNENKEFMMPELRIKHDQT
jgi:hypothetical protein